MVVCRDPSAADPLVALLPHRPPFRFVDAVDVCEPGRTVTARWRIGGDEAWLAGHFPANPVVPGVPSSRRWLRPVRWRCWPTPHMPAGYRCSVAWRTCGSVVRSAPCELVLEVEIERLGGRGGWGRGRATVEGDETCRGRLLFVLTDAPS